MAINLEVRNHLPEDAIVFDNPSFDNSIIGTTLDGRAIYSMDMMIVEYMTDEDCSEDESIDWICYNTMRALPYFGAKAPLVVSVEV